MKKMSNTRSAKYAEALFGLCQAVRSRYTKEEGTILHLGSDKTGKRKIRWYLVELNDNKRKHFLETELEAI